MAGTLFLLPIAYEVERERQIVQEISKLCEGPVFVARLVGLPKTNMSYVTAVRLPECELSSDEVDEVAAQLSELRHLNSVDASGVSMPDEGLGRFERALPGVAIGIRIYLVGDAEWEQVDTK